MDESKGGEKYERYLFDIVSCLQFFLLREQCLVYVRCKVASKLSFFIVDCRVPNFFSMLSNEEVQHIAKLARLGLKEDEIKKFAKQLNDILDYMKLLEEVDTRDLPLTSQVTGLENVSREDSVERMCEKEELLGCTELPVERDQIRVKPVITEN